MKRGAAILIALGLALLPATLQPAAGQPVCRVGALGSVGCLGQTVPRPKPRPQFDDPRGLEEVLEPRVPGAAVRPPVPPRRTNAFGDTRLAPAERGAAGGPCRRDALGNLRCR